MPLQSATIIVLMKTNSSMSTITTQLRKTLFIIIAFAIALGANVAYGQWSDPTATPPNNNAAVPVNVGGVEQYKQGNLRADEFHSNSYCDENGDNCVSASAVGGGDPLRCQSINVRKSRTFSFSSADPLGCSGKNWACMATYCGSRGYDPVVYSGSGAYLRTGGSSMTTFTCNGWDTFTICGNY